MVRYLLRRLGFLILTLLLTSILVFSITQVLPGDVARIILGREAGEPALEALRQQLGINDPLPVQYFRWLGHFATGNWGISYSTGAEIRPIVTERLVNSLLLASLTLMVALPVSIGLGIAAGLNANRPVDNIISIGSLSVVGLPEFVTGLVLIQLFSYRLGWFPANSTIRPGMSFFEKLPMLILPALTATLVFLAYVVRLTRAGIINELKKPYVRTAELKGIPYRVVIFKHVLRNALLPTITVIAISIGWLISGLIVIENVYNYPGLGRLLIFAIDRRDFPLLQAVTMVTVVIFVVANLAADFLYSFLDPRIRYQ